MADFSNDYRITYGERSCQLAFRCFDTPNSVTIYGCDLPDYAVEDLLLQIRRLCLRFHNLWSFSQPQSDIARINAATDSVEVDESTARLLRAMKRFHETEPAFDFTVGPLSFLWKHAQQVPTREQLERARAHVGAGKVRLEGCTVVKLDPHVQVDVGGAAKGFVADELVRILREQGIACADIDLGGNLYLLGQHPAGRPWRISVKIPEGVQHDPIILQVTDRSVVTSGSYERFVEIDGVRYQHIVDATTGWPARSDIVSATVVAESSLEADMLATTALLVDSAGIEALRQRHPQCAFTILA